MTANAVPHNKRQVIPVVQTLDACDCGVKSLDRGDHVEECRALRSQIVITLDSGLETDVTEMLHAMDYISEGGDCSPGAKFDPRDALSGAFDLAREVGQAFASGAFLASLADSGYDDNRAFEIAVASLTMFSGAIGNLTADLTDDDNDTIEAQGNVRRAIQSMIDATNVFARARKTIARMR